MIKIFLVTKLPRRGMRVLKYANVLAAIAIDLPIASYCSMSTVTGGKQAIPTGSGHDIQKPDVVNNWSKEVGG